MIAQEQKQQLRVEIATQLEPLNIPSEVLPYIQQFMKECNVHQLQNLISNMSELKKFVKKSIQQYS